MSICTKFHAFTSYGNNFKLNCCTKFGWLRGSVVERRSSAGALSLSCARPVAEG